MKNPACPWPEASGVNKRYRHGRQGVEGMEVIIEQEGKRI
jgi:hypothetical protein